MYMIYAGCYKFHSGVFYNELETRIRLSKRVKGRDQKTQHSNTILAVQHREMDENEKMAQNMRRQVLILKITEIYTFLGS